MTMQQRSGAQVSQTRDKSPTTVDRVPVLRRLETRFAEVGAQALTLARTRQRLKQVMALHSYDWLTFPNFGGVLRSLDVVRDDESEDTAEAIGKAIEVHP